MAIQDQWFKRDGTPTTQFGQGKRWKVRWHDTTQSFEDSPRKAPSPHDKPPKAAERYWFKIRAEEPQKRRDDVLVGELLTRWLASKARLSKSGYTNCRVAAARVQEAWGTHLAQDVTSPAVREWVAGLEGSSSKVRKTYQALQGALQIAVEEGVLAANPCQKAKLPKEKPREANYRTAEQVRKLALCADACGGYGSMIWFMATTGLRIGEVCALNIGDIDKKRGRVRVRAIDVGASKSDARDAPLPAPVMDMLDLGRPKSAPLFTAAMGGRIDPHKWRARYFKPAAWLAWMDGLRPHDLRHTAVSLAVQNGAHVKVIQRMVGHKPGSNLTEGRYAHLFDEDLDQVADRLGHLVKM